MSNINVAQKADEMGARLLACIPFPKPNGYKAKVLCFTAEREYVVWTYDARDGSFHDEYSFRDLSNALDKLKELVIRVGYA